MYRKLSQLDKVFLGHISRGETFGEIEALFKRNPNEEIESKSYCTLAKIYDFDFQEIVKKYP